MQAKREHIRGRAVSLQSLMAGGCGAPFWISAATLLLIVHATHERAVGVLSLLGNFSIGRGRYTPLGFLGRDVEVSLWYLSCAMGLLFLGSTAYLLIPVVRDGHRIFRSRSKGGNPIFRGIAVAMAIAFLMAALAFHPGNASMGIGYAERSLAPFLQESGWYHKRLLMPFLAHILFLRGGWLYYGFSMFVLLMFLVVTTAWLRDHAPVQPWQLLSLFTSSFAIFALQYPGYPDILAFTLLVLVMSDRFGQRSRLSLLVLALLTHEATLFMGILLAWFYLDRPHFVTYLASLGLYAVLWAGDFNFQLASLLARHDIYGKPAIDWAISHRGVYLLGVFISFKAIWLLVPISLVIALKVQQVRAASFILGAICTGILLTLLGIDTSRMMGFAFPGILVAMQTIRRHMSPDIAGRMLKAVFAVNLLIPSFYVGTNTGVVMRPGLYGYVLGILQQMG